jgi:hypothetical protein
VVSLSDQWQSVPQANVSDDERASMPLLRAIAADPARAHEYVVKPMAVDEAAELRALGRRVAAEQLLHPHFVNTPRPMVDAR